MLRNKTAFTEDIQKHIGVDPRVLNALLESPVPNNNLAVSRRCRNNKQGSQEVHMIAAVLKSGSFLEKKQNKKKNQERHLFEH